MPRKPLSQLDIDNFREAYCDAAYTLYQREGYDAVTMRRTAKVMDCSPMLAYRYFANKEDVFAALRAALFHRLARTLEDVVAQGSALDYLQALGAAYAKFAHDEPDGYRLLYMIHNHRSDAYPETEDAQKRTRKILIQATRKAVEAGDIAGDPTLLAHTLWASIHGLVSLDLAGQLTQGASFDELFPALLQGLVKQQPNPAPDADQSRTDN